MPDQTTTQTSPPTASPSPQTSINWREAIPKEVLDTPDQLRSLEKVTDIGNLIKSYVHAQQMIGSSIRRPGESAKQEEWDAFYSKLGRPESADKYNRIEKLPEGLQRDEVLERAFYGVAHQAGLSQRQVDALVQWWVGAQQEVAKQYSGAQDEAVGALQKDWGDAYDANLDKVFGIIAKFTDDSEVESVAKDLTPGTIRMLYKIANAFGDDKLITGGGPDNSDASKTAQAKKEIADTLSNLQHPFHNRLHPHHRVAQKHMADLYKQAYPDTEKG